MSSSTPSPGVVRAFLARHPRVLPWTVVLFVIALGFDTGIGLRFPATWDWWEIGVTVVVALSLLWWRTHPWPVLAVVVTGDALSAGSELIPFAIAVYALTVYRSLRAGLLGSALAVVTLFAVSRMPFDLAGINFPYLAVAVAGLLIGSTVATRRRYLSALLDRAVRLAREKEQEGQLAAARERARIARDLHDIVAHNLTVMVRLADGATAVAGSDPERSRKAVERVSGLGRDAMKDMRRLLGVLRDGSADDPGDLASLVETFRIAGLPVTLRRSGPEPADAGLQRVVFRTVQEALTNALRYAEEPGSVLVDLDFRADPIRIAITDDGRGTVAAPSVGSGQGLIALRERVDLYGGTVEAGRQAVGWAVHVTLPHLSAENDE